MHLPLPITLLWPDTAEAYYGVNLHKDSNCCPQTWGTTCANLCPVLGPGHLVGMLLWCLFCFQVVHVRKVDLCHLTLGMGLSSSLCMSSLDKCLCAHLLWTKAFVFIWLAPDFDRHISHTSCSKVSCYSANGCLGRTPEPGQMMGWQREGAEGESSSTPGRSWQPALRMEGSSSAGGDGSGEQGGAACLHPNQNVKTKDKILSHNLKASAESYLHF